MKLGQLLVQLRDDDFRAQVQQAEAGVPAEQDALVNNQREQELQDARIVKADEGIRTAEGDITAAESGIDAAKASMANARSGIEGTKADVAHLARAQAAGGADRDRVNDPPEARAGSSRRTAFSSATRKPRG